MAEAVTRAFWPLWSVIFAALAPVLMGWLDAMSPAVVWGFAGVVAISIGAALVYGARGFRWPHWHEAVARVDALMPGRPIAALADSQAIGADDAGSQAVWQAHVARMATRTRTARAAAPDLRLSRRDPFGLRYIALLFFVVALGFGSVWRIGELGTGERTGNSLASGPTWEGWIEPPAYTGKPSLYLADIPPGPLRVPAGSTLTLRLYGELGALAVAETVSDRAGDAAEAATDPSQSFVATKDGTLEIKGDERAAWTVTVVADHAPSVTVVGTMSADAMGELSQPFHAEDDYGVIAGTATITLDPDRVERRYGLAADPDPRAPLVIDLPLPITGDRANYDEVLIDNLSQHAFANLPVVLQLAVSDAAGQQGIAPPAATTLPGRRFFQPVAKAVIEQRRDLLWTRQNAARVLDILRAVSYRPEDLFTDDTAYLKLSFALTRLAAMIDEGGLTTDGQDEIAQALWDIAVQLEDGSLADARARLERAQERLAEAMRNGASDAEIAALMQELRDAVDAYTQMLAEQNGATGDQTDQPDNQQADSFDFTREELQALMDRIQELMEEGRMAEAQELMDELNNLMENMQVTQGENGEGSQTPGQQSMQELADTLRNQQDLSDDAFRNLQDQFNGNPGRQQGQQGQQSDQQSQEGRDGEGQGVGRDAQSGAQGDQGQGGEADAPSLADRQQALRDELARQSGNLPNLDGQSAEAARRALERAEGAMGGAEDALRDGDLAEAIDRQAEAMDALRDGLRNLGDALAQNDRTEEGQGSEAGDAAGRLEPTQRDPLGRQIGNTGQFGTDENILQGQDVYRRAEELLDELRRRSAEQDRPEVERDYLDRLLDRF